jgi:alanine dehydrogenase
MPLLLTEADVRQLLDLEALAEAMARALVAYSTGAANQPLRAVVEIAPHRAFLAAMPAYLDDPPALGAKLVSVYPDNHARDLPSHLATILLFDPETGALAAVMDGRCVTETRTAAVSAVSVAWLAPPGPAVLALVGSGVQARSHLEAIARVRPLEEVRVYSPTPAHRERFAAEAATRIGVPVRAVASVEAAVRGATIIVTATNATAPVVANEWVQDGAHICAVGACRPTHQELDSALVARARVFVDSRAGALAEAGDLVVPIREGRFGPDHIVAELGEVVAGRARGRTAPGEVTLFKSLGMAVEDVAAAELLYRRACARGVGRGVVV